MSTGSTWTEPFASGAPIAATWASSIVRTTEEEKNVTSVTEFVVLGFQFSHKIRILIFFLLIMVYCFTIFMNLLIITLVSTSNNLHTPMYFFLTQLSINDILVITNIVPIMLYILLHFRGTITFIGCMTQLYLFCASEVYECLLLTVMSYDRYVAICNPLRYTSIMKTAYCVILVIVSWLVAFSLMMLLIITISMLNFCGSNIIDHFFCDSVPILELSCSDTHSPKLQMTILSVPFIIFPIFIIIFSYSKIIITVLRIPSSTGRQKAFSTCSSHLIVVSIFYWSLFSAYVFPTRGRSSIISKILSLLYTVFTPLINPIIYSLKNQDIKKALHDLVYKHLRG